MKPIVAYVSAATLYQHGPAQAGFGVVLKRGSVEVLLQGGARDTTENAMLACGLLDTLLTVPINIPLTFVVDCPFYKASSWSDHWAHLALVGRYCSPEEAELWKMVRLRILRRTETPVFRSPDYLKHEELFMRWANDAAWKELWRNGPRPRAKGAAIPDFALNCYP